VLLDARYGGHIASYSSRYGTAYGYLDSSLRGRDEANGGVSWTSQYSDIEGRTYSDGIIPEGIFQEGQMITAPSGESVNVGGMTYQEAYDQGLVEPTHASFYNYFTNSWGQGVVNDNWFKEVKYIAIRNISLGYNLPKSISDKLNARNLYIGVNARNLGYIYNSLPNNINPESFRGTGSADSFRERSFTPYTASYTMTISLDF
ncbi:MAG: SusC/RagA family TonB-linked outer membrane protein, partial [Leeuwenhoekiella sp.]|nr:SusC/RagA family TonB-linked outer membrane protein [Leeuwenhoekiella sp.]